jgi:very-short-patch-repair endonuclease
MQLAFTSSLPLTPTLSPEGRGGDGGAAGERAYSALSAPASPRPSGERVRVRGTKAQPAQIKRARTLRQKMTDAESRLWHHLRDRSLLGFKFVRQYPIAPYYADFACREAMLVVEADGGQHADGADLRRDAAIGDAGYKILRFWNNDILGNTDGVLEIIHQALASRVPSPLRGEGQGEGSLNRPELTSK